MTETKIGTVTHYFNHLHVAGVTLTDGELHKGDVIHIKGHTSDFEQKVESMQIDHEAVQFASLNSVRAPEPRCTSTQLNPLCSN